MRGWGTSRGRLLPLFLFVLVLAVVGGVAAGVVQGAPTTTAVTAETTAAFQQSASYKTSAADLGALVPGSHRRGHGQREDPLPEEGHHQTAHGFHHQDHDRHPGARVWGGPRF